MFCEFCGQPMDASRARCANCHKHSNAFWLTAFGGVFFLLTLAGIFVYFRYLLPVIANIAVGVGSALPVGARLAFQTVAHLSETGYLVAIGVVLVASAVLVKKRNVSLGRPGKAISAITIVVLLTFLVGIVSADVFTLEHFPNIISYCQVPTNEINAVYMLNDLNAVEHELATAAPPQGYACDIADLFSHAKTMPSPAAVRVKDRLNGGPEFQGYKFSITGCSGPKSSAYKLLASPIAAHVTGKHVFCAESSGAIASQRIDDDGNSASKFVDACR